MSEENVGTQTAPTLPAASEGEPETETLLQFLDRENKDAFTIATRRDLIYKVADYVLKEHGGASISVEVEGIQDPGYSEGPDITIRRGGSSDREGLYISLSQPGPEKNGYSVESADAMLEEKRKTGGSETLRSSNYDEVVRTIRDYVGHPPVQCPLCDKRFESGTKAALHAFNFHKVSGTMELERPSLRGSRGKSRVA